MEKRCSKCGEVKLFEMFSKRSKARDGRNSWCLYCVAAKKRETRRVNGERVRASERRKYHANIAHTRMLARRQYHANAAHMRASMVGREGYVRRLITLQTGLPADQIPDELVEMKRLLLKGKRTLKQLEKELKK